MKISIEYPAVDFPYEKYCSDIISIVPQTDIVGITEIRFVNTFSHPKSDKESIACYLENGNKQNATIEINMINLIK